MLHLTPKKGHVQNPQTIILILKAQNHYYEPNQPANRWRHVGHVLVPSCPQDRLITRCMHNISKDSQFSDNNVYMPACQSPPFQIQAYYLDLFFLFKKRKKRHLISSQSPTSLQLSREYNYFLTTFLLLSSSSPFSLHLLQKNHFGIHISRTKQGWPNGGQKKEEVNSSLQKI